MCESGPAVALIRRGFHAGAGKLCAMHADFLANTRPTHPPLVPEIGLRLLDEAGPWAKAGVSLFAEDGPRPYWAFAWGSGQALARYLLDHPEVVAGRRVYDFGTGSGIVAIAAAKAGAAHVTASEIDPAAAYAAGQNAAENGVTITTTLDAPGPGTLAGIDLFLAADTFFHWPDNAALLPEPDPEPDPQHRSAGDGRGMRVLIANPPRRAFARGRALPARRLNELASYTVKACPELEPGHIKTAVVYELV